MIHDPQPQEEKLGYHFQSGTGLRALESDSFQSFLKSVVCKWFV